MTDENQVVDTATTENKAGNDTVTPTVETKVETSSTEKKVEPYKSFSSKEEFDKHSLGILNSAKNKAEKELLAMLGLKPDEKDKLSKFKEAYDNTLSESEKQAKTLENLNVEVSSLKNQLAEKNAIISALTQISGKNVDDVDKYVKMAKGLVDENTNIDVALEQVFSMFKVKEETKTIPQSKPLNEPTTVVKSDKNPFETDNITEQGKLIMTDRAKARELYFAVHGKAPNW